jgi:hypothetical protein
MHPGEAMHSVRDGGSRVTGWARGTAIALAVLTLAIGLCLFDGDAHDTTGHAGALDLCLGMLAASLAVPALGRVVAVGDIAEMPLAPVHFVARAIPDPPPRLLLTR